MTPPTATARPAKSNEGIDDPHSRRSGEIRRLAHRATCGKFQIDAANGRETLAGECREIPGTGVVAGDYITRDDAHFLLHWNGDSRRRARSATVRRRCAVRGEELDQVTPCSSHATIEVIRAVEPAGEVGGAGAGRVRRDR